MERLERDDVDDDVAAATGLRRCPGLLDRLDSLGRMSEIRNSDHARRAWS